MDLPQPRQAEHPTEHENLPAPVTPAARPQRAAISPVRMAIFALLAGLVLVGVLTLGSLTTEGLLQGEAIMQHAMQQVRENSVHQSTLSLTLHAEQIINQHAVHVAGQVESYLAMHPDKTVRDLQLDPIFQRLAVQTIGRSGYSALTDCNTLVCRFHPSTRTVNVDLHSLATMLPGFWRIMSATEGGRPAHGYYDWQDDDGHVRHKYMSIVIVPRRTADNVQFSAASTAYVDEFLAPAHDLEAQLSASIDTTTLALSQLNARTRLWVKTAVLAVTALVISAFGILMLLLWRARTAVIRRTEDLGTEVEQHRQTEAALRESEARYRGLVENIDLGITLVDRDFRILMSNARSGRSHGRPSGNFTGQHCFHAFRQAERLCDFCPGPEAMRTGRPAEITTEGVDAGGQRYAIQIAAFPLHTPAGELQGFIEVVSDITTQRQLQEQLRQAEKMQAIGQLAGGIAHDFNNRLVAISGFAQILAAECAQDDLRGYAERIVQGAKRASDLTSQLLAFARKGDFQSVPVDVHDLIGEVVHFLRHSLHKQIEIKQRLEANPPVTRGDPTQLQNALLNLAINARDAMPTGGALIFATRVAYLDEDYCQAHPYRIEPGEYLQIAVTDSGIGMDKETQKHIFEPFFTTKPKGEGTGMGLAAVFGTVKHHQGLINVYSEPGHGSSFKIYLPLLRTTPRETRPPAPVPATGTAHIMVIDDEDDVRDFVTLALRRLGYRVTSFADGSEAVACYRAEWQDIDLVLMDLVMPRLSGRETFLALRAINPLIKLILATGYSLNSEAREVLDEGAVAFVQKPFPMAELAEKIAAALGSAADG